jgi:ABC-type sugar transport system substrate-binding protein
MLSSGDNRVAGQLAATTAAAALGSQKCSAVLVQNAPGNTVNVAIGDSNNQYFSRKPGQACTIPCSNVSQIYAITASSTGNVNWSAIQ